MTTEIIFDFIAELTYFSTEDGGRKGYATTGYRPAIRFPFDKMYTSGYAKFIGRDKVNPGETVTAKIAIVSGLYFAKKLDENQIFEIGDPFKIVGKGQIIKMLNRSLLKSNIH